MFSSVFVFSVSQLYTSSAHHFRDAMNDIILMIKRINDIKEKLLRARKAAENEEKIREIDSDLKHLARMKAQKLDKKKKEKLLYCRIRAFRVDQSKLFIK
jgi:hypothetical protein